MRPLLFLLTALAVVGCQNVPITGRSQFILVEESEVASMSASEFSKMKKLPSDQRLAKIREIGLKIVAAARRRQGRRLAAHLEVGVRDHRR